MTTERQNSILFIDDDVQLVQALSARCRKTLNLEVKTAHNAFTALGLLEEEPPSLVCIDVNMPTGNGLDICQLLAGDRRWASIPVIVLTGRRDKFTIRRCQELSAHYVPKGADTWDRIEERIRDLLEIPAAEAAEPEGGPQVEEPADQEEMSGLIDVVFEMLGAGEATLEAPNQQDWSPSPPWILSIEDDRDFSLALKLKLERRGISVIRAFDGMDGVKQANNSPADAIILDYHLPNGQGDFVLRRLKANAVTKDIPVIVLTGVKDQALEQRMMSLGADKFLTKPLAFDDLLEALQNYVEVNV